MKNEAENRGEAINWSAITFLPTVALAVPGRTRSNQMYLQA